MPEIAVKDLPDELRQTAVQTREALKRGNAELAIALGSKVLAEQPGCLDVRRLWHEALVKQNPREPSAPARAWGAWARVSGLLGRKKSAPNAAGIAQADTVLRTDPWSKSGWRQLAQSAAASGLPETATFAWGQLAAIDPTDRRAGVSLVRAHLDRGEFSAALAAVENVLKHHPQDSEAQALLRRASIDQTVKKGNWDTSASFRDKLRD